MGFPLVLLPFLLAGADPEVIATGDHFRVEQALSDGVRARVEAGWHVVDIRTVNDELVVTVARAEAFERHVVHFDKLDTYRVEREIAAPTDADEVSDFTAAALAAPRGGMLISAACGDYYVRPYLIDEHATGEFAASLVARALSTAENVSSAASHDGHATFTLHKKGVERDLVVWVDPKGNVIEAQLRRFEYGGGGAMYKRSGELKKALAKTRVTAVVGHGETLALVTPRGRFVIDPNGAAFGYDEDEGEGHCGC